MLATLLRPNYFFVLAWLITGQCIAASQLDYRLLETIPRDSPAFTQGLEFNGDELIESSGLRGKSYILKTSQPGSSSATAIWHTPLPAPYFAEGLSQLNGRIYLLSWQQQTGWIIHPQTGRVEDQFTYQGQGWGLAAMEDTLVRSDGSHTLFVHETEEFNVRKKIDVRWNGRAVNRLNELEYAQGYIWANIWQSSHIVAIDPNSGEVAGWLDLSELSQQEALQNRDYVLNGIAYHRASDTFWVTGKRWKHYYRLKVELP